MFSSPTSESRDNLYPSVTMTPAKSAVRPQNQRNNNFFSGTSNFSAFNSYANNNNNNNGSSGNASSSSHKNHRNTSAGPAVGHQNNHNNNLSELNNSNNHSASRSTTKHTNSAQHHRRGISDVLPNKNNNNQSAMTMMMGVSPSTHRNNNNNHSHQRNHHQLLLPPQSVVNINPFSPGRDLTSTTVESLSLVDPFHHGIVVFQHTTNNNNNVNTNVNGGVNNMTATAATTNFCQNGGLSNTSSGNNHHHFPAPTLSPGRRIIPSTISPSRTAQRQNNNNNNNNSLAHTRNTSYSSTGNNNNNNNAFSAFTRATGVVDQSKTHSRQDTLNSTTSSSNNNQQQQLFQKDKNTNSNDESIQSLTNSENGIQQNNNNATNSDPSSNSHYNQMMNNNNNMNRELTSEDRLPSEQNNSNFVEGVEDDEPLYYYDDSHSRFSFLFRFPVTTTIEVPIQMPSAASVIVENNENNHNHSLLENEDAASHLTSFDHHQQQNQQHFSAGTNATTTTTITEQVIVSVPLPFAFEKNGCSWLAQAKLDGTTYCVKEVVFGPLDENMLQQREMNRNGGIVYENENGRGNDHNGDDGQQEEEETATTIMATNDSQFQTQQQIPKLHGATSTSTATKHRFDPTAIEQRLRESFPLSIDDELAALCLSQQSENIVRFHSVQHIRESGYHVLQTEYFGHGSLFEHWVLRRIEAVTNVEVAKNSNNNNNNNNNNNDPLSVNTSMNSENQNHLENSFVEQQPAIDPKLKNSKKSKQTKKTETAPPSVSNSSLRHPISFVPQQIQDEDTCLQSPSSGFGVSDQQQQQQSNDKNAHEAKIEEVFICPSEAEIWRALHDVSRGLAVLHKNGICHNNLHPRSVFVDAGGRCKIGCFGVCRKIKSEDLRQLEQDFEQEQMKREMQSPSAQKS